MFLVVESTKLMFEKGNKLDSSSFNLLLDYLPLLSELTEKDSQPYFVMGGRNFLKANFFIYEIILMF